MSAAAGFLLVTVTTLSLAEIYLRSFPPADLHDYLGDGSPLEGPFVSDPGVLRIAFPDYAALRSENPESLGSIEGLPEDGTWIFFSTSFVHMRGALRDTFAELVPTQPALKLDRREPLLVRVAQIQTLLEAGCRPGRLVLVLMPVDIGVLGTHDLASITVNSRGAMVMTPRLPPPPLDRVVQGSRLALTAWTRTGRHQPHPGLSRHDLYNRVPAHLQQDLASLFRELRGLAGRVDVPVTLLLIPTWKQTAGRARHVFQDTLMTLAREADLDALDLRAPFEGAREPRALYIHDGHLSQRGYRFATRELMRHLDQESVVVWPADEVEEP